MPDAPDEIERATQRIGRSLLTELRRQSSHRPMDWIADRLMALTAADERLKVELFRFVDALPALHSPAAVARHLREYLDQPGVNLPPGGHLLLRKLAKHRWTDRPLAEVSQFGAKQMARRFIAGANAAEAARVVERLRQQNLAFTLDLLGEFVTSPADAARYQQQYLDLIREMAAIAKRWPARPRLDESPFGPLPRVNVSVKLSALYAGFDPLAADHTAAAVKDRLRPILSLARDTGSYVHFDMEQHDYRSITRRIFNEILMEPAFRDWADVGIVIQAYLRDSADDLDRLIAWAKQRGTPVWVRLVKGAYWDYETILAAQRGLTPPVFAQKSETDANFERLTRTLIANWQTLRPAIATHNVRSAAHAMAVAQSLHLPARVVEYQVLLGMGGPIARALARRGQRVRVYAPFGQLLPGMAYLVRRLLENTSNESFIRQMDQPSSHLLVAPRGALPLPKNKKPGSDSLPLPGGERAGVRGETSHVEDSSPAQQRSASSESSADQHLPPSNVHPLTPTLSPSGRGGQSSSPPHDLASDTLPLPGGERAGVRGETSGVEDSSPASLAPSDSSADQHLPRPNIHPLTPALFPSGRGGRSNSSPDFLVTDTVPLPEGENRVVAAPPHGARSIPTSNPSAQETDMIHRTHLPTFRNEPETDFSLELNQQAMRSAVAVVRANLGRVVPVVIDGREEISQNLVDRPDPSDVSRVASRVHYASKEQAERAIESADRAFAGWRDTPVADRAAALLRVANYFRERRFHIAAWEVFEVGKPCREADADVAEAIDFCTYYAAEAQRLDRPQTRNVPGEWNDYLYEPRGVTAVIAPWNFPLAILTGMTAAALATGNTVVIKPAEQSSRVGYFLAEALQAAEIPPGVANFLPGDGEVVGPVLVNDRRVATIAFTGSRAVGLSIMRDAAVVHPGQRHVKRVIAEMGGKNAILIDDDSDLDEAVVGVLASATGYAGQKCSACSRVIAIGPAYEPFIAKLKDAIASLRIGPADDPATTVGPVVDAEAKSRVERYLALGDSGNAGRAKLDPPAELRDRGYYVPVAVFEMADPQHPLCQEEIFGPVLAVLRAGDLSDALAMADDSPYALTGGFYSRSPVNIARVRREFRVGNLYINRKITGALVDRQPFGGARLSGVGAKAGGPDYLLQFMTPRTVTESVMRRGFAPTDDGRGGE